MNVQYKKIKKMYVYLSKHNAVIMFTLHYYFFILQITEKTFSSIALGGMGHFHYVAYFNEMTFH